MPHEHETHTRRGVDRFSGLEISRMSADEVEAFLSAIVERSAYTGAENALIRVGLNDSNAGEDVRDLRALIKGYRVVRSGVWKAFWSQALKVASAALTIYLVGKFFTSGHQKEIMQMLINP